MRPKVEVADEAIKPGVFVADDFSPETARLRGARCPRCQEVFFPARQACPRCHTRDDMQEVALARTGRIGAITAVVRPPQHYPAPYWLAEVELPEGVRVVAQVEAAIDQPVPVGAAVELTTRPLLARPNGQWLWGYVFAPVGGQP
ncbi:MAG TPA: OB-fold domain-containing protein [Hyphomicrobiaceae bacterium]|jgi:uncharacterized OB-fold protein|nr:OB-fold domain-containing protein [Hyphomicrobiaceae bacterium]